MNGTVGDKSKATNSKSMRFRTGREWGLTVLREMEMVEVDAGPLCWQALGIK